jgi:cold shock CspA family protein
VAVEAEHRYPSGGEISYSVKVQLSVPGEDLVVSRQDDPVLLTAIQRAFDAARRQLQDHVRRLREPAAVSPGDNRARVTKLFTYEGFGFLETATGEEVYFHRNSVLNDQFDQLEIGTEVRFALGQGNKGPQASTVSPVGKPRRNSGPSKRAM